MTWLLRRAGENYGEEEPPPPLDSHHNNRSRKSRTGR